MAPDFKKQRDRKLLEIAKRICAEIKNLSLMKNEYNKKSISIINNELKIVQEEIEQRQDYFIDHKIDPLKAVEYIESVEKAQNVLTEFPTRKHTILNSINKSCMGDAKSKGKNSNDMNEIEQSVVDNCDTYAYSVSTHKKSPSILETFSCIETSPVPKRVKTSEDEEEEKLPILNDNFSLGESYMSKTQHKSNQKHKSNSQKSNMNAVRKSTRKRTKSKILREACGEDYESIFSEAKSKLGSKLSQDINKIRKIDSKVKKAHEAIPWAQHDKFLTPFKYKFDSIHKDVV